MNSYGWRFVREYWTDIPGYLSRSESWQFVDFSAGNSIAVPSKQPGVYVVCTAPYGRKRAQDNRNTDLFSCVYTPMYVGKTDDLRRRFLEHCRKPSPKLKGIRKCFGASLEFWFHPLSLSQISENEARLIRCFGPPANEREEKIKARVTVGIPVGV